MWKGLINNDVDAAFATTITGPAKEAETSPRGLVWPPLPHSDNAGWERVQKVGSFFFRHMATCGAGIPKDKPIEMGTYPYPIFVVYGTQTRRPGLCRHQGDDRTGYDAYKDAAPGAVGLAADQQTKKWVVPVHPGAVEGAQGSRPVERRPGSPQQRAAQAAGGVWRRHGPITARPIPPSDDKEFLAGWMKARAAALQKANMPNGFEN